MLEIFILSIVQGVTEFLPVSSSAHLILISKYFDFNNSNITLDISLHFGSLLAVLAFFKKDIKAFVKNQILFKKIILTSIPTVLVGFFLTKVNYLDFFRNYTTIGITTLIFGILLLISDKRETNKSIHSNFSYKDAILIGLIQVLSLFPGVSRSGITITGARFLNLNRVDAAKISFLTSIPILIVISTYNIQKIILYKNIEISISNIVAVALSFIFSYLTIKLFLNFLKKFNLFFFVIYRMILGIIIILYAYN